MNFANWQAGRPSSHLLSALGTTTALGICCLAPNVAKAQCDVNPTQTYQATTCTGTDASILVANTNGSTVTIQPGASVASIYATTVPVPGAYFQPANGISIFNNGQIVSGLTIDSGPAAQGSIFQTATNVSLSVGAGASVGGNTAINLIAQTSNFYGATAALTLSNQGTIQSGSGAAITGNGNASAQVTNLNNQAGGYIAGIQAIVGNLVNSGTIAGGTGSAIDTTVGSNTGFTEMAWQNSGTITSNGAAATLNVPTTSGFLSITNSGTIANSGIGNAIATAGQLSLVSTGTITGSVEADNAGGTGGSSINLGGGGSIGGSLILGGGANNTLTVDYAGGANPLSSITGPVSIGTNNTLVLNLPGSTTLSAPIVLPGAFSMLGLQLASGSTVTLASGFSTPLGLTLNAVSGIYGGTATLANAASLDTVGAALLETTAYSQVSVANTGTITANLVNAPGGTYAVTVQIAGNGIALANSGTISGNGGNGAYVFGSVSNTGTITADGTALAVFNGTLSNSGAINGGDTGLTLFGGSGTNTGTISGGQIGASLASTTLTNSGTITSTAGAGITIGAYTALNNQAGGVITGGIALSQGGNFANTVNNAGTINGNVALGGNFYTNTNDTYVAMAGGVLNGNLNLGSGGDKLVVTLGSAASSAFAGITGSVTGSGTETLLTLVTANATVTLTPPAGIFSVFGYDLANNATLSLGAAAAVNGSYTFAGTGTVNLTADITGIGASNLLNLTTPSVQTDTTGAQVPSALNFTSNGNLTVSAGGTGAPAAAAVVLGTATSFTNNGTISYNNAFMPLPYYNYAPAAAILGSGTVTNNGTIQVGGGAAIAGGYFQPFVSFTNTGSILQMAGATDAVGVLDVNAVTNSGTIATGGIAVAFNPGYLNTLVNTGTITSTDSAAIGSDPAAYSAAMAVVTNKAGGVIGGGSGQPAIMLGSGSTVVNSGTINGNVQLGASGYNYGSGSTYVADGGALNGNLSFSNNNNTLLVIGASSNITGTIDAGTGTGNLYAQGFTATTSIDLSTISLPAGFQSFGAGAIGAGTVLTISSDAASGLNTAFAAFGNGTVINTTTINSNYGQNLVTLGGTLDTLLGNTGGLAFVNSGNIADGVQGTARSFTNSGTIGPASYSANVMLTAAPGPSFTFSNSGQIAGSVFINQAYPAPQTVPDLVTIQNSGTISYGLIVQAAATQMTLNNSGAVNAIQVQVFDTPAPGGLVTATNAAGGLINYGMSIYAGSHDLAFANAGQISQSLGLGQNMGGTFDQAIATVSNTGTINGYASMAFDAAAVSLTNTGTIVATQIQGYNYGGLSLVNTTVGNSTVAFSNSGTISNVTPGQSAAEISVNAGSTSAAATTSITVTNTGRIAAVGGGVYEPFFADQFIATGLAVAANAPGGSASIAITNAANASITANGANTAGYGTYGIGSVPPDLANGGSIALVAAGQTVNVINAGTITGGSDTYLPGAVPSAQVNGLSLPTSLTTLAGAIDIVASTASLTNTGTINGNTILFAPAASFANYGTVNGNVMLGTGAGTGTATMIEGISATLTGTVTGTAAVNALTIDVTGGGVLGQGLLSQFIGFGTPQFTGSGVIAFSGPISLPTLVLNNAALTLAAGQVLPTTGPIALIGASGTNTFVNYGTVNGAIVDIATTNGAGGIINIATTAATDAPITNNAGAQLNFTGGAFTIAGLLTNHGAMTVATGATLDANGGVANAQGGVIQVQAGATVNDVLVNAGAVINNGVYNADIVNQAGGTFTAAGPVTSPNLIRNAGTFTGAGSTVSTPEFDNLAGGFLAGSVTFNTAGGALLTNQGSITGNVAFGAGANELLLGSGSQITGTVTGGSGSNLLAIMSGANDAAPDQFALGGVSGFQQSTLLAGSVVLSGNYTTGTFAVQGGHLIGKAGSVLNAATITVASGAAFGSAGTVNGNVAVNGTLAPNGIMTVNGNVAFGSGSSALFNGAGELAVSGTLKIANGATLALAMVLPQRQGAFLQLIKAGGGITGAFSLSGLTAGYDVIDTANTVAVYNPFIAGPGFGRGAAGALSAINTLVVAQHANAALLTDLVVLDNAQGTADAGKFAQLTPEPYATAMQIGIDNSLQIADSLRDFDNETLVGPTRGRHIFAFGEALGKWTHADGDAVAGSSKASNSTGGLLAGLGWRGDNAAISVFGGGIHGQQTIAALGARTMAHSSLFGANALVWGHGFDGSATLAFDNGIGDTMRALPDGTTTWSHYGLRAMVADGTLGYTIGQPKGWTMHPQIGLTHVTVHRDVADELGSTAFELAVAAQRTKLDFAHASLRIAAPTKATSRFSPWASLGVRVRLAADTSQASAYLPDAEDAIVASGAMRAKTQVTYKAGFGYALSSSATLFGSFDGDRGNGGNASALNGGIRVAF